MASFSELLVKMAQGQQLLDGEREELRLQAQEIGRNTTTVSSWLRPGSSDPHVSTINAEYGRFSVTPVGLLHLELFGDNPQAIAHDTETDVLFDTTGGLPVTLRWNISEQTKIYTLVKRKRYAFFGTVQWETNADGRRAIHINAYDADGVEQWGQTLHSLKPEGTEPDTMPFAAGLIGDTFDETAYLTVSVLQTSGGDLDLQYLGLSIIEIY